MPGLFGVVRRSRRLSGDAVRRLADRMAGALRTHPWLGLETSAGEDYAGGRIFTGGLNPEPQPLPAGGPLVWFDGQIFDPAFEHGRTPAGQEALRLLDGRDALASLDGVFALAAFDPALNELALVTDRLGFRPLYWAETADWFAYAPAARGLLAIMDRTPPLDEVSLRQFLAFDHLLGNRTWWRGIEVVPPGSVWRIGAQGRRAVRYWTFDDIRVSPRPEAEVIAELAGLWSRAVAHGRRPGLTPLQLSGGLDSRVVLAELRRQEAPVTAITFGAPDSADVVIARRCARVAGVGHRALELGPDTWWSGREEGIAGTDGLVNAIHLTATSAGPALRAGSGVSLQHIAGDSLFGGRYVERAALPPGQSATWPRHVATLLERYYLANPFFTRDEVVAASREDATMYVDGPGAECFFHRHRQRRFILAGPLTLSPYCDMSYPGVGLPVLTLLLGGSSPEARSGNRLYSRFLVTHYPEYFARIPWQATGRPVVDRRPSRLRRAIRRVQRRLPWRSRAALTGPFLDHSALVRGCRLGERLGGTALIVKDVLDGDGVERVLRSPQPDARLLLAIVTLETYLRQTAGLAALPAATWEPTRR